MLIEFIPKKENEHTIVFSQVLVNQFFVSPERCLMMKLDTRCALMIADCNSRPCAMICDLYLDDTPVLRILPLMEWILF